MTATAPKKLNWVPDPDGVNNQVALVYSDSNGSLAHVTSPWYLSNGIYVPAPTDSSGNPQMSLAGSKATNPFSGNSNTTHTFTQNVNGFVISNDGSAALTFTIGTDTYTVNPGEVFKENFAPFTTVTISATGAFRAYGLL